MSLPTPLLLFLGAVAAAVVLTGGLGVSLAIGFYLLDRKLREVAVPAKAEAQPGARPALITHRVAGPGAAIFALVVLMVGVLVGRYTNLMPVEASTAAGQVDVLFSTMLGIASAIFVLVEGVLLFSSIRFRRKKGEEGDGLPIHGSNRLEFAWTVIPALIVLWLGAYSYQILAQVHLRPPSGGMTVEVISQQFQWQFHYPDTDITASDLYLPVNKPVSLKITSRDVLHSFWVPAFRVKQDAIPDQEKAIYFTPDAVGEYRVVCAELCGAGHARMGLISRVIVQSQADFDAWVSEQQAAAGKPPDPVVLFTTKYGCNGCHTLTAAGATGNIGPDLNGIGTQAATRVPGLSAEEYIRQSILEPNAFIAPKCPGGACPSGVMPQDFAQRMSKTDLDTIVNFLLQQK